MLRRTLSLLLPLLLSQKTNLQKTTVTSKFLWVLRRRFIKIARSTCHVRITNMSTTRLWPEGVRHRCLSQPACFQSEKSVKKRFDRTGCSLSRKKKRGRSYRKWREYCWVGYKTSTWYCCSPRMYSPLTTKTNTRWSDVPKTIQRLVMFSALFEPKQSATALCVSRNSRHVERMSECTLQHLNRKP